MSRSPESDAWGRGEWSVAIGRVARRGMKINLTGTPPTANPNRSYTIGFDRRIPGLPLAQTGGRVAAALASMGGESTVPGLGRGPTASPPRESRDVLRE